MKERKLIVMFTFSPFPFGEAVSNRIYSLAMTFKMVGYEVIILSNGGSRDEDYNVYEKKYIFNDIEYRDYNNKNDNRIKRVYRRSNIHKLIKNTFSVEEINRINFLYFTYRNYGYIPYVLSKALKLSTIVDVTEWHSKDQFFLSVFNLKYITHNFKMKFIVKKARNIICISEYLKKYFESKNCNIVIIPPQINIFDFKENKMTLLPPIKFVFGGTAAKKDYINIALDGLCLLSEQELKLIKFTLVGIDKDNFMSQFQNAKTYIKTLRDSLVITNKVSKQEFQEILIESHFLVLLRPIARYSQAGFPSKVPEALAAGLPVITNYTSDLSKYIINNINGFVVQEFSAEDFRNTIRNVLSIKQKDFVRMSKEAYVTAEKYFNYDVHANDLIKFLNNTIDKKRR